MTSKTHRYVQHVLHAFARRPMQQAVDALRAELIVI